MNKYLFKNSTVFMCDNFNTVEVECRGKNIFHSWYHIPIIGNHDYNWWMNNLGGMGSKGNIFDIYIQLPYFIDIYHQKRNLEANHPAYSKSYNVVKFYNKGSFETFTENW